MELAAFLFDLDGVIIDTESQYDVFWKATGEKYNRGIPGFEKLVKGITLPNILAQFFSDLSEDERIQIAKDNHLFDLQMDIQPIPGAMEFLQKAKEKAIPMGLVTSSNDEKLDYVFSQLPIKNYFDTIVSADRITRGKPDPMCYLLAAQDLNVSPEACFVFEDSFNGIKSGNAAGMKVVGLSTTNPKESIEADCVLVIPDFTQPFSLSL